MARLGIITIGQAPRVDLTPALQQRLPGVCLLERGALDGLTQQEITALAPNAGDEVLTTRLTNGSAVIISGAQIWPLLQRAIRDVEASVDAVLLACTGGFPTFDHVKPLINPDRVIAFGVAALAQGYERVGVISPLPAQEQGSVGKFQPHLCAGVEVLTEAASPYTDTRNALRLAATRLGVNGAEIIALDCMGYTDAMRRAAADASGVPVVLARSIVARFASELLESLPKNAGQGTSNLRHLAESQDVREAV